MKVLEHQNSLKKKIAAVDVFEKIQSKSFFPKLFLLLIFWVIFFSSNFCFTNFYLRWLLPMQTETVSRKNRSCGFLKKNIYSRIFSKTATPAFFINNSFGVLSLPAIKFQFNFWGTSSSISKPIFDTGVNLGRSRFTLPLFFS